MRKLTKHSIETDNATMEIEYISSWLGDSIRVKLDHPSKHSYHVADDIRYFVNRWLKQTTYHKSSQRISYKITSENIELESDDQFFYLVLDVCSRYEDLD